MAGEAAIQRSGSRINLMAALSSWNGAQLTRVLRADPHARLDAADLAFYVEPTATATGSESLHFTIPGTVTARPRSFRVIRSPVPR